MITKLLENLERRGFTPFFAESRDDVCEILSDLVMPHDMIGFGGSQTVVELEIPQYLDSIGAVPLHVAVRSESYRELSDMAATADWFITSTNAITQDGELVNTDGKANRIANLVFGADKVLVVVGTNKIVTDIDAAFHRIRTVAAPKNCIRLGRDTPCAHGVYDCTACSADVTICRATEILHHPTTGKQFYVIVVDGEYGY